MPFYALLIEAHPVAVEGDCCVLGFDPVNTFHRDRVEARKAEVANHLSRLLHQPVRVVVCTLQPPSSQPPQAKSSNDPDQDHRNFVQEGLDMFGGRIVG